jgi:NADH-quinone oxidoreductase subunit H
VVYLLTIPTLTFFLGGWNSCSLYSMLGSVRTLTQLFAFEIPLFMGILAPALLANTWSLSKMTVFYIAHPWWALCNVLAFAVSVITVQGKLEKVPFDIPEAETEIVAGVFTEYSGRLFAFFRMAIDMEVVVVAALLAAVFIPFGLQCAPWLGFVFFLIKVLFLVAVFALLRSVFARLRLDQTVRFCWKVLAPMALLQLFVILIVKGMLVQ